MKSNLLEPDLQDKGAWDISIEFEIQWKFVMLFMTYSADNNGILHTSRQLYCRDECKISLWSVEKVLNQSTPNFHWISNSIEISFMGRAPWQYVMLSNALSSNI